MMSKKVIFIFLFSCFVLLNTKAQNLVSNPSFEDTISCPTSTSQLNKCLNWINPTQASPDYFNSCSTANGGVAHIPDNGFGFQYAHAGNGYAGFYTGGPGNGANNREYVQTALTTTLIAGKEYYVSFNVNLSNMARYAISKMGAYLSVIAPTRNDTKVINYTPQIKNSSGFITDTINWIQVSGYYSAQGGEQYLTIGNFYDDSVMDTLYINHGIYGFSAGYYYIDDVSVIDSTMGISEIYKENYVKVFPNPANDFLNVECKLPDAELKVFNILGNEVTQAKISYKGQIDISNLNKGVYFIRLQTESGIFTSRFIKE